MGETANGRKGDRANGDRPTATPAASSGRQLRLLSPVGPLGPLSPFRPFALSPIRPFAVHVSFVFRFRAGLTDFEFRDQRPRR